MTNHGSVWQFIFQQTPLNIFEPVLMRVQLGIQVPNCLPPPKKNPRLWTVQCIPRNSQWFHKVNPSVTLQEKKNIPVDRASTGHRKVTWRLRKMITVYRYMYCRYTVYIYIYTDTRIYIYIRLFPGICYSIFSVLTGREVSSLSLDSLGAISFALVDPNALSLLRQSSSRVFRWHTLMFFYFKYGASSTV